MATLLVLAAGPALAAEPKPPLVEEEPFKPIASLGLRTAPPPGNRPSSAADVVFASKLTIYAPSGHFPDCFGHAPCEPFAAFCRPTLYFEDACLERCGAVRGNDCLQSALSGAHFFADVAALPFRMCVDRPCGAACRCGACDPCDCP